MTRQVFTLVLLRHDFEHPQVVRRFGSDRRESCEEVVAEVIEVRPKVTDLAQFLDLTLMGDARALHMALDPGRRSRARCRCWMTSRLERAAPTRQV